MLDDENVTDPSIQQARIRRASDERAFLAEATPLFTATRDPNAVLTTLARLAVPRLGDWCSVEMIDGDSSVLSTVAHVDPQKVELARALREKYPPDRSVDAGVFKVIRTGKPELDRKSTRLNSSH